MSINMIHVKLFREFVLNILEYYIALYIDQIHDDNNKWNDQQALHVELMIEHYENLLIKIDLKKNIFEEN